MSKPDTNLEIMDKKAEEVLRAIDDKAHDTLDRIEILLKEWGVRDSGDTGTSDVPRLTKKPEVRVSPNGLIFNAYYVSLMSDNTALRLKRLRAEFQPRAAEREDLSVEIWRHLDTREREEERLARDVIFDALRRAWDKFPRFHAKRKGGESLGADKIVERRESDALIINSSRRWIGAVGELASDAPEVRRLVQAVLAHASGTEEDLRHFVGEEFGRLEANDRGVVREWLIRVTVKDSLTKMGTDLGYPDGWLDGHEMADTPRCLASRGIRALILLLPEEVSNVAVSTVLEKDEDSADGPSNEELVGVERQWRLMKRYDNALRDGEPWPPEDEPDASDDELRLFDRILDLSVLALGVRSRQDAAAVDTIRGTLLRMNGKEPNMPPDMRAATALLCAFVCTSALNPARALPFFAERLGLTVDIEGKTPHVPRSC